MSTYEYQCKDCRILSEKTLTLAAHEREPVTCPKCGSLKVEQGFTTFYPVTSKKSARAALHCLSTSTLQFVETTKIKPRTGKRAGLGHSRLRSENQPEKP